MATIDYDWFYKLIRNSQYGSLRRLAPMITTRQGRRLDIASLSRMLHGKRSIQLHEARQLGELLDVPLYEIIKHAGIGLEGDGSRLIKVFGFADEMGDVDIHLEAPDFVEGHANLPAGTLAIIFKTALTARSSIDGWTFFFERLSPLRQEFIGRLCFVIPKKGTPVIAFISRGYKKDAYNLFPSLFGNQKTIENAEIRQASPILWIKLP